MLCCRSKAYQHHRNMQDHHHAKVYRGDSRKPIPHLRSFRSSSNTNANGPTASLVDDVAFDVDALDRAAQLAADRASILNPLVFTIQRELLARDIESASTCAAD